MLPDNSHVDGGIVGQHMVDEGDYADLLRAGPQE